MLSPEGIHHMNLGTIYPAYTDFGQMSASSMLFEVTRWRVVRPTTLFTNDYIISTSHTITLLNMKQNKTKEHETK